MMTDIQLLIISTTIGLFVSWFTARQTASSEAVKSLSFALSSLRTEFEAVKSEYEIERKENQEIREAYEKISETNRLFKRYIDQLVDILTRHNLEIPKMDGE